MKIIANVEKKTLRIFENERSIFRGEYGADKLELYINKQLENEYPTITALLSNGRKIGPYSTDEAYGTETIDGVTYTVANFTLSKANGFTLSEGKMMITIWMNSINGSKQALGNITLNVINTTAFDDGDIIISGDVEGTIVNIKVELENLQGQVNTFNGRITNLEAKKFIDLGTITESPENAQNTILNTINDAGVYTFTYDNNQYLMLVNTKDNNLRQIVIGIEMQDIDIKYWIRHPYYDTFTVTAFKTTDKHYVEEEFIKVRNFVNDKFSNLMGGENINEMYDTIKEIAEALASNKEVDEAINNALVNKANKTDIPTKISQLEQDVELGVSEEQVMEIIEQNSEEVGEVRIATSDNYDVESDNEIPTTKAVASMCKEQMKEMIVDVDLRGEASIELGNNVIDWSRPVFFEMLHTNGLDKFVLEWTFELQRVIYFPFYIGMIGIDWSLIFNSCYFVSSGNKTDVAIHLIEQPDPSYIWFTSSVEDEYIYNNAPNYTKMRVYYYPVNENSPTAYAEI